ncbi:AT-rich interactive domain-containing protein 4B-like isoform X2 [Littorina saxatilis]|uniref:AT-rich interactive domain-containing protein 4B-like isoform X2 n=1 Tax=Littorina saxatilis TaxID=31220 RepID=UPI0038B6A30A
MDKFVPAFLPIGTEVSAKYRGAFCEAKVKKALKRVVMKVAVKESQQSLMIADEHLVTGVMKVGNGIEFKHPETSQVTDGVISKITDQSTYTVVFNDGDERTLRRTQLCLKGDKHFEESETLDNLPLSHPEHFGTPVLKKQKNARGRAGDSESEKEDSSSEDETKKREFYKNRHQELVGRVMLVEIVDKRKGALTPVLVVLPDAHPIELKNRDHLLVRSFRDMKYMAVNRKDLKDFSRDVAIKNEDKALKAAFERALLYYDNTELPINWNREQLLGPDEDEDDGADESSDDDEQCEEKDRFVAQLYKFMDDRGTPINKGPCIGNKDLNLYRLFRVVQNIGGYNKATNQMKWRLVYSKMGLPPSNSAAHQIKNAYKKYLHAFEDFYRKLGSSMGTISRPGRQSRQSSSRGILSFRDREKDSSPRSPRTEKPLPKEDKNKEEEKSKPKVEETSISEETEDAGEHTPLEESDSEMVRRSTPRREKAQKEDPKSDKKEDQKNKKEEDKKEEAAKEDKKKDDKREERKSLRQSQKEEEKKDEHKIKKEEKEEKKEAKKDEGKVVRVLRKDLNEKEEDVKKEKEPEDQNQKDAQKKRVTRRKSNRVEEDKKEEDEKEEEEEKGDDKKKEKKEKEKKQPGSTKKEKPPTKKAEEEEIEVKEENKESEDESEEEASSSTEAPDQEDLPLGTKLKVRYGRGRNQKIYEAKIVEHGTDGPRRNYLVHYAGWNTRYDEWVKSDRIMAVVDRPEMTKLKRKSMGNKSPKGSSTPPLTKPETPPVVVKKRGRQPSVQQVPSPGGTPTTKAASSPIPSGEPKTPKGKAVTTGSGSASKTRSTRSNSTEIKPDSVTPSTSKHRITRRSSGVGDSVGDFAAGDGEGNFESDMESEAAPPSGAGDITSEREEEEDTKESELDISMEEQQEEPAPPKESDLETKPLPTQEEESSKSKAEVSNTKQNKVESEPQPQSLPLPEMSIPKETSSLPELALHSVDVAAAAKESVEHVAEPAKEVPQKQEPLVTATEEEKKEAEKEESTSQPDTVNEEAGAKEEPNVVAEDTASPAPTPAPALVEKPEATKAPPADDPTIPHLKKIDDLPSPNEKKEKEKNKFSKKLGRESKKGRQNEMRTSLSEIPTLEPMTTPPEAKQPPASDITPSPYDFNDADVESPSPWQPEITKKWEPSSKPLPLFRDIKMELKKSLETEKKKVKKKVKKAAEEATKEGESAQSVTESPTKLNEKKLKDLASSGDLSEKPPPKKKGRKKKMVDGEAIKPDVSSYEETVNSVVESLKADEYVHIPLPPSLEPKEEKPVKKRKSKVLDSASPAKGEEKDADISKKEPGKAGKGLKGKVGRKKKDAKASDSAMDHSADPVPLPFSSFDSQNAVSQPQQDKTPSAQLLEPVAAKQPRVEAELPLLSSSSSPFGACAPGFGTVDPQAGPSGLQILSMASIRPLPSTSDTPGSGSGERLAPSLEGRNEVVKQAGAEPRADFAGDVPRAPCGGGVGNTVLDNTPPTTPENDLDEANSASSSCEGHDHLKEDLFSLDSGERTSKGGSESPPGCDFSLSSTSSENLPSSSSGVQCGGKPLQSSETVSTKRKQKDDSAAPAKKRKKLASRTTRGDRSKKPPKFGDDDSQSRSPFHQNGDSMSGLPSQGSVSDTLKNSTPRPQKFHFADDLGEYLKGESRIQFLLDKMKEVRKVYQGIKSEIAGIDRKRKRARRREKERESSQASAGERDAS